MIDPGTTNEKGKILKKRAQELALPVQEENKRADSLSVIQFLLAGEKYGVVADYVAEVLPVKDMVALPCTPQFVLGTINIRGEILAVIDIKKIFDLPEKGITNLNQAIIVSIGKMRFGILTDTILGLTTLSMDKIQPALPTLSDIGAEYLKGITSDRLILLDLEKMASDHRILVSE